MISLIILRIALGLGGLALALLLIAALYTTARNRGVSMFVATSRNHAKLIAHIAECLEHDRRSNPELTALFDECDLQPVSSHCKAAATAAVEELVRKDRRDIW